MYIQKSIYLTVGTTNSTLNAFLFDSLSICSFFIRINSRGRYHASSAEECSRVTHIRTLFHNSLNPKYRRKIKRGLLLPIVPIIYVERLCSLFRVNFVWDGETADVHKTRFYCGACLLLSNYIAECVFIENFSFIRMRC